MYNKRIYLSKRNSDIINMFRRGNEPDNHVISFIFDHALRNPEIFSNYSVDQEQIEKLQKTDSQIIKLNKMYRQDHQRSNAIQHFMKALLNDFYDIDKLYKLMLEEKELGEILGENWDEFDMTFDQLKKYRNMASEMRAGFPQWEKIFLPKCPDDIQRWYNHGGGIDGKTKPIRKNVITVSKIRRLLEAKSDVAK